MEVCWTFLTAHPNLGKFTVVRLLLRNFQVKQREYFVRLFFFSFLTKDNNLKQFVVAHTVLHKYG